MDRVLFFCFLSALWDGTGAVSVFQKPVGEEFSFVWRFDSNDSIRFFCKRQCQEGDVLIKTEEDQAQSGRYGIKFEGGFLTVTITQLIRSDSGRYRLGLGTSAVPDEYGDFEVRVTDGLRGEQLNIHSEDKGGTASVACFFPVSKSTKFFCRGGCSEENLLLETTGDRARSGRYSITFGEEPVLKTFILRAAIARLITSDSGRYTCGLGSSLTSASFQLFEISVYDAPTTLNPNSTLQPFSPSAPSAATPSTARCSCAGSSAPSSALPETTDQCPVLFPPLVVCVVVVVVLSVVVLLLLYRLKTNSSSHSRSTECVTLKNRPPGSTGEDSVYQSLDPSSRDQDQTYCALRQTHNTPDAV